MFRWWNIPLSTYPKSSLENTHLSRGLLPFIHKAHHINAGLRNTDTRCPFYLIPENILNKRGKLNEEELEIMQLHSKLSEEILSTQNIAPEVLNIVKYHHQNKQGSGYPIMKNTNQGFDINTEVVALADKFSALKESRSYKISLTDEKSLEILKRQVEKGEINPRVFNALVGYVNSLSTTPVKISNLT